MTNGNTDLVIDINGYYAPSTGITLAQGTAGGPSLSFSGDTGTGIFSSAPQTLNFTTGGTTALTIQPNGDLNLLGNIRQGGSLFLSDLGVNNLGVGLSALANNISGSDNTATGFQALFSNTTGQNNTASGYQALYNNTTASGHTAIGFYALADNTTGTLNSASGAGALWHNTTGSNNTASGVNALGTNIIGSYNTANGLNALFSNTAGSGNIAVGASAGYAITFSNNIDIGNQGIASDVGVIRIGTAGTHTSFWAAGVQGVMTGHLERSARPGRRKWSIGHHQLLAPV